MTVSQTVTKTLISHSPKAKILSTPLVLVVRNILKRYARVKISDYLYYISNT